MSNDSTGAVPGGILSEGIFNLIIRSAIGHATRTRSTFPLVGGQPTGHSQTDSRNVTVCELSKSQGRITQEQKTTYVQWGCRHWYK